MKTHEIIKRALAKLGGAGSGHHGHKGRPGQRGGSSPGGGGGIPSYVSGMSTAKAMPVLFDKISKGEITVEQAGQIYAAIASTQSGGQPAKTVTRPSRSVATTEESVRELGLPEETIGRDRALAKLESRWLQGASSDAKQEIVDMYAANPDLKDLRLYQLRHAAKSDLPFEEFKDTPLVAYRGGPPMFGETFSSFTLSKPTAEDFAKKHGGSLYEIRIKPKDLVGFAPTGASELFVPYDAGSLSKAEAK